MTKQNLEQVIGENVKVVLVNNTVESMSIKPKLDNFDARSIIGVVQKLRPEGEKLMATISLFQDIYPKETFIREEVIYVDWEEIKSLDNYMTKKREEIIYVD